MVCVCVYDSFIQIKYIQFWFHKSYFMQSLIITEAISDFSATVFPSCLNVCTFFPPETESRSSRPPLSVARLVK